MLTLLKALTPSQRNTVIASYLGWTLDAFDFFILVFVLKDIAQEFKTDIAAVSIAITLTLAARPIGALLFGLTANRYGRRITLMIDILLFSALEFSSGLAPSLVLFLAIRFAFGVATGREWGVGAALAMETMRRPRTTRKLMGSVNPRRNGSAPFSDREDPQLFARMGQDHALGTTSTCTSTSCSREPRIIPAIGETSA